eukprot:356031-Chlamydomonas_euryale.AAC.13
MFIQHTAMHGARLPLLQVQQGPSCICAHKARLALAKFMCTEGTLLVLDEPTNHLDIPSKEMLEEAITQFEGAVIAVSHDRYFLRRIATRVLTVRVHRPGLSTSCRLARVNACVLVAHLNGCSPVTARRHQPGLHLHKPKADKRHPAPTQVENQTLTDFQGDYDYYLEQNQDEAAVMDEKAARQKQLLLPSLSAPFGCKAQKQKRDQGPQKRDQGPQKRDQGPQKRDQGPCASTCARSLTAPPGCITPQLQQENTKATSKMTKAERTMLKKQKAKEFNEATAGKGRNAKGKK